MFKEILVLFAVYVISTQVRYWYGWRAWKKFEKANGCGDAPTVKNGLPWGIERYYGLFTGLAGIDFLEDIIRARYDSMGCYTYRLFNPFNTSVLTTADPENVQAILATKFHDFDLGPARRDNFYELMGNGIFTAEGESWAHFRTQLKPQFSRDQVSDLEAADRHLQLLYRALPDVDSNGWMKEADLLPLIYRFTMDVSTEFLFGQSVNSQTAALQSQESGNANDAQEEMDFAEAMNLAQEHLAWRIRLSGLYWLSRPKKFRQACKTVKDFTDQFVRIALDLNSKRHAPLPGQKEKFVLLNALVAETRNPAELRDQVLQILIAGRDTTSSLLSWAVLLLSRQPSEFTKLRKVIISQFGTEQSPREEMTFTNLKACKPLSHVLHETLRLYPLIPINGRFCLKDTFLPVGGGPDHLQPLAVRKGEQVGYSAYVMQRRKDIWGEDADEFRPGRWEGRKLGWEFIAFSGGPRICLGQQYALNEASFVVAKLLQRFDGIEGKDLDKPIKKRMSLTLSPRDGVRVRLHRASA